MVPSCFAHVAPLDLAKMANSGLAEMALTGIAQVASSFLAQASLRWLSTPRSALPNIKGGLWLANNNLNFYLGGGPLRPRSGGFRMTLR